MSMRYTGKNWQTMRKVGRNDQTLLEQIRKAKRTVSEKAHADYMRAAMASGAIGNGKVASGEVQMLNDHALRAEVLEKIKSGEYIADG